MLPNSDSDVIIYVRDGCRVDQKLSLLLKHMMSAAFVFSVAFLSFKLSEIPMEWTLKFSKSLNNPIHAIFQADLTNDGMKELCIVTLKTVIVLQHDVEKVAELCRSRYLKKRGNK